MKIKQFLFAFTMLAFAISFNSCKKATETAEEFETTFELSGDQAIADNLSEDAGDMFNQVADENNLAGGFTAGGPVIVNDFIPCATVTITPAQGFPKTIVIDFGTNCVFNGNVRSGKINITLSDSVRKSGSVAVMTFTNYIINGYKLEGTHTWTNTSTANTRSWTHKTENGKVTNTGNGRYWTHSGLRTVVQTAGVATPARLDDVFSITGNHTVANSSNVSRDITVLQALTKRTDCANISGGQLKVQGPNHYAVIDFGDPNTCDNLATLSIDGRTPRTIILR
ncbi:MAG: hypothetical protein JNM14_06550 [Ferruginibacter sp.]|nr:hypothetical protein [Ferruginibacter sp.]